MTPARHLKRLGEGLMIALVLTGLAAIAALIGLLMTSSRATFCGTLLLFGIAYGIGAISEKWDPK